MSIGVSEIKHKDREREKIQRDIEAYQARGGKIHQLDIDRSLAKLDSWKKQGERVYRERHQRKAEELANLRPIARK